MLVSSRIRILILVYFVYSYMFYLLLVGYLEYISLKKRFDGYDIYLVRS